MSGVQAFNDMLKTFLQELADVFPEDKQISGFLGTLDDIAALDPNLPMNVFMKSIGPHAKQIAARDESVMQTLSFPGADIAKLWNSGISDATKDAIWQYLNMLLVVATTVSSIPPDVLKQIESLAGEYAEKIERGEVTMDVVMREAMKKLQDMNLSDVEGLDLSALTAGLGLPNLNLESLTGMLGGDNAEQDVLAMLEAAKPPQKKKKSSKK